MARQGKTRQRHPLKAAKAAISRTAKKAAKRLRPAPAQVSKPAKVRKRSTAKASHPVRREADIPLDVLAKTYTPRQTSLKAPFRASGKERQRDQEFASGHMESRWNDEDRLTNRSGDPRIGTHRRTYEPEERKGER